MSRGQRGGAGGLGVRTVANVLGITRQDVHSLSRQQTGPPPLYPPIARQVVPLNETPDLSTMLEIQQKMLNRFHTSPFYHTQRGSKEIRRYTDKYQKQKPTGSFNIDFSRLPAELNWKGVSSNKKPAKIRKLNDTNIEERIAKLEENAEKIDSVQDVDAKNEEEEESETEQRANQNEEENEFSDEDYLEEDNDYVANYFDNGEGVSDDDLEEFNTY